MIPQTGHCELSRAPCNARAVHPGRTATSNYWVFAVRDGMADVTNWVASSTPTPSGVGTERRYGTRIRVPEIGANQTSMLRWAARYLIAGRSGMKPETGA